jgi:hypothetical protein
MIERQIDSPIPMPPDLVVKKGLNSRKVDPHAVRGDHLDSLFCRPGAFPRARRTDSHREGLAAARPIPCKTRFEIELSRRTYLERWAATALRRRAGIAAPGIIGPLIKRSLFGA